MANIGMIYVLATSVFQMGVVGAQIGNGLACRAEKAAFSLRKELRLACAVWSATAFYWSASSLSPS
jgi:hypothetical protein